jgi:agmatinase
MHFEDVLKNYCIPNWLRVSPTHDDVRIAEVFSGRKYVLKGAADEVIRYIHSYEKQHPYVLQDRPVNHLQLALDSLLARGFVKERSGEDNRYPIYIKPGKPIFGSSSLLDDARAGDIVFFGAPTNFGNRHVVGTAWAPDELRSLSDTYGLKYASISLEAMDMVLGFAPKYASNEIPKPPANKDLATVYDAGNVLTDTSLTTSFITDRIKAGADTILQRGAIPFMIGGDHLASLGVLRALSEAHDVFDVVHIDAHTDTYARAIDYMVTDGLDPTHANFMRVALNEIDQIGHVYQYGIRGLGNMAQKELDKQSIHWIYETKQLATERKPLKISDRPVYVTVDIDVLDPSVAPATGSPLPNGLSFRELVNLLHNVIMGNNVIGIDVVEVDVSHEAKEQTKVVALEAIAFALACLKKTKR